MEELSDIQAFEELALIQERQSKIRAAIADSSLADDNVRRAYEIADEQLSRNASELKTGALGAALELGSQIGEAVAQLDNIKDLLDSSALDESMGYYRPRLQALANFLLTHYDIDDPEMLEVQTLVAKIGGIVFKGIGIGGKNSKADLAGLDPVSRVAAYAQNMPAGSSQDLPSKELWSIACGDEDFNATKFMAIRKRLTTLGVELRHNGRRGSDSRYTLHYFKGAETLKSPIDEALSMSEVSAISTFFNLFRDRLQRKGIEPISGDLIDRFLDLPEEPAEIPDKDVTLIDKRVTAFGKAENLVGDPAKIDSLLSSMSDKDPRHALLIFLKTLDGKMSTVAQFIDSYKGLGIVINSSNKFFDITSLTTIGLGTRGEVRTTEKTDEEFEKDRLKLEELKELGRDLSTSDRVKAKEYLEGYVALLKKFIHDNKLETHSPYSAERWNMVFSRFELGLLADQTYTGAEIIMRITATSQIIINGYGGQEQAMAAIVQMVNTKN